MSETTTQLIKDLERLCALSEPTPDDILTAGRLAMELGCRDLKVRPGFDFRSALDKVGRLYRSLLDKDPRDARALNDLGALLLSSGDVGEGRRLVLLALAAAPSVRTVHENVRIADIYCRVAQVHEIPQVRESDAFLRAYFDPHAH